MLRTVAPVHAREPAVIIGVNELVRHRALHIRVALQLVVTQDHLRGGAEQADIVSVICDGCVLSVRGRLHSLQPGVTPYALLE